MPELQPRKNAPACPRAIEGIRAGLASMKLGKGRPINEFFADLRAKLALAPKKRA